MKRLPLGTKFYTAPPAPVSVPAAMEMDDDFDSAFEHGKAVGWNACRAKVIGNMFLADMYSAVTDNTNQQFESLSRDGK